MRFIKNLLLIAGTGRNTGKTSLACAIIQNFHHANTLIGVKISPHFHPENIREKAVIAGESWRLYEEKRTETGKDSSLMFHAGALRVFYIEVKDEDLPQAWDALLQLIPDQALLVCESPALRKIIEPAVFIIVDHPRQKNKKQDVLELKPRADCFVDTNEMHVSQLIPALSIKAQNWQFDSSQFTDRQNK